MRIVAPLANRSGLRSSRPRRPRPEPVPKPLPDAPRADCRYLGMADADPPRLHRGIRLIPFTLGMESILLSEWRSC